MDSLYFDTFGLDHCDDNAPSGFDASTQAGCTSIYNDADDNDRDFPCATCRKKRPGQSVCWRCFRERIRRRQMRAKARKSPLELALSANHNADGTNLDNDTDRIGRTEIAMPIQYDINIYDIDIDHTEVDNHYYSEPSEYCPWSLQDTSDPEIYDNFGIPAVNENYHPPVMASVYCRSRAKPPPPHYPWRQHFSRNCCRGVRTFLHAGQSMQITLDTVFEPLRPGFCLAIVRWATNWGRKLRERTTAAIEDCGLEGDDVD
ncbi:hypothetical protein GGR57DRAFT_505233 [Xylariaceae sp. FL1272]|nr:hypothetical protein GGR57DRAFT_505233 [Xylariaceae sp. FL1272]